MECKFCNNKFSSISTLNKHVKYANYCINKRSDNNINNKFICDSCHQNIF